jgi:hypothetical protein
MADEGTAAVVDAAPTEGAPAPEAVNGEAPATGDEGLSEGGHKALAAEREAAKAARREAATLKRQLEQLQKAQMSDTERAITEAKESTAAEVRAEFGQRLAKSALVAAAATAGAELGDLLEYIDLKRFVGDDGELNDKAIASAVDKLPRKQTTATSFDGGPRGGAAKQTSMDDLIRGQVGARRK